MNIIPSVASKKPSYPALLAVAAMGAMLAPACAQNEAENPPVPESAKASQLVQKAPGAVKAQREPQRIAGRKTVRPPQSRAGAFKLRNPEGKGSAKSVTPPEKK